MTSCLVLEQTGKWRVWGVAAVFLLALFPSVPLLLQASSWPRKGFALDQAFTSALVNSFWVALAAMAVSLLLGLPAGVLAALYRFPAKKALLSLLALPLLAPSFLWAIGWSSLAAFWGRTWPQALAGFPGSILVFSAFGVPIVLLTLFAVTARLSAPQLDAACLAGGEKMVFRQSLRNALEPALLAASLAGVLTLSDPGPGFVFGLPTAASEILTSFSARYDFSLAGRQCVLLTGIVLLLATPLAFYAAPRLAGEVLSRQMQGHVPRRHLIGGITTALLLLLLGFEALFPLAGLVFPLTEGGGQWGRAFSELLRTLPNTLIYSLGAGLVGAFAGFLLAFLVGRSSQLRRLSLGLCIGLFSLPPTLAALGVVHLAASAPAWTDPLLRSRLTVCFFLGLRFFPLAAVLGIQAWARSSPSWTWSAALHGVPLGLYLRKVVFPFLGLSLAVSISLVALLAAADVDTALLLHPPGEPSFPLVILTVMANAPESLVASLCLLYVGSAAGLLSLIATGLGSRR